MVSVTHQTISTGKSLGQVTRPARILLGWLQPDEAHLMLAQRMAQSAIDQSHVDRAKVARETVAQRAPYSEEVQTLSDPGGELSDHINKFVGHPDYAAYQVEGWAIKIVDLSKVIALQPVVLWDHAVERTQAATPGDMPVLAGVTLPIRDSQETLPFQFDPARNTWMITSRNPNLRIVGQFSVPMDAGNGQKVTGCGFAVAISPSFVQVARYKGRLLLRDGYHRSLGLLQRGITHVPVLFREFGQFEPLGIGPGMLPEAAYMGERPPFIADYLSDVVSTGVDLPASQKMIVVQGTEMSPMG